MLLGGVGSLLTIQDPIGDVFGRHEAQGVGRGGSLALNGGEEVERDCAVVPSVQRAVENLLYNVIYYIM